MLDQKLSTSGRRQVVLSSGFSHRVFPSSPLQAKQAREMVDIAEKPAFNVAAEPTHRHFDASTTTLPPQWQRAPLNCEVRCA
jgi:hypothetical protein